MGVIFSHIHCLRMLYAYGMKNSVVSTGLACLFLLGRLGFVFSAQGSTSAQHIYVQIVPITKYYVICYIKEEWLNTPPKGRQRHPLPCSGCDKVKRLTHGTPLSSPLPPVRRVLGL